MFEDMKKQFHQNKTILITGGAGFIGSSIAERVCRDNKVIVLDDLSTGAKENLSGLVLDFRQGHTSQIAELVPEKVDLIFHLGIASSTMLYLNDRTLVGREINGSIAVFEKAVRDKAKVVIASSSSIYNQGDFPSKENQAVKITDFYTECRLSIERLAELYSILYNMRAVCLRMFAVYGGLREKGKTKFANMVTKFLWRMMDGKNPVSYGDGTQTRDFTYIDDIVDCWLLSALWDKSRFEIFNLGTGKEYDFNAVGEIINKVIGTNLEMQYEPNPLPNFVFRAWADTGKAEKLLGFSAKITLEQGIKKLHESTLKDQE
ncbi:MAG: NAD-dependent epimerase/dehydratase family protein [Parcubacteria group bacterium]|nr:NAD-dependent epimerase/dehydratase family protein [Parcubacteria group bacterium]